MSEKRTRNVRNNRLVVGHLQDSRTMQAYAQSVLDMTKNDKPSPMCNKHGFVTPCILDNHTCQNLLRLSASIVHQLSQRMARDTEDREEAREALRIVAAFATSMRDFQENARNERILRQADEIRKAATASLPA